MSAEKITIHLGDKEVVLDPELLKFNETTLSSFLENEAGWYDYSGQKLADAEYLMQRLESHHDVMYAERFGVSDAAKERKALAIGNVINTQASYPDTVVASALWNMEPTIDKAIAAVKAGQFKAEDYGHFSMMKFKGSELSPLGTFEGKVPKEVMDKVMARQKAILDGSFTVKVNDDAPKAR